MLGYRSNNMEYDILIQIIGLFRTGCMKLTPASVFSYDILGFSPLCMKVLDMVESNACSLLHVMVLEVIIGCRAISAICFIRFHDFTSFLRLFLTGLLALLFFLPTVYRSCKKIEHCHHP
ncbi:hypothetical protein Scep_006838 [Stephania cephalantha]|uniref:Uncharacterized protein n=1 Tax=Stephania cephalantha TaxID=152367 RepID=A0AAP0K8Y0_9MAGN